MMTDPAQLCKFYSLISYGKLLAVSGHRAP
jgi:hypothetical protein